MIYYFSGTGNSQWVAEELAVRTKDSVAFIPDVIKKMNTDIQAGPDDVIGIVFPIYAWAVPEIVMQFLKHIHADDQTFTYAVCTCNSEVGGAFPLLEKVFPLKSAYSVEMPDNCITLFDSDRPELIREKLNVAKQRMPIIAMNLLERRPIFEIEEGPAAKFKTAVISPLFALSMMNPRRFYVEPSCTGCGLCEKNCPLGTIKLVNNKPVWEGHCQQCMSCIMRCPVQAIQYGPGTKKRKRYFNQNADKAAGVHTTEVFIHSGKNATQMTDQIGNGNVVEPENRATSVAMMQARLKQNTLFDDHEEASGATHDKQSLPAKGVEYIAQKDIRVLSKLDLFSRQLISPLNSKESQITMTEVHLMIGASQERHVHASSEQVWYALRGTGVLLLADAKERTFVAGDVVRFAANVVHGIKNNGTDELVYLSVTTPPLDFSEAYSK